MSGRISYEISIWKSYIIIKALNISWSGLLTNWQLAEKFTWCIELQAQQPEYLGVEIDDLLKGRLKVR